VENMPARNAMNMIPAGLYLVSGDVDATRSPPTTRANAMYPRRRSGDGEEREFTDVVCPRATPTEVVTHHRVRRVELNRQRGSASAAR
jgi:hypothetical protein